MGGFLLIFPTAGRDPASSRPSSSTLRAMCPGALRLLRRTAGGIEIAWTCSPSSGTAAGRASGCPVSAINARSQSLSGLAVPRARDPNRITASSSSRSRTMRVAHRRRFFSVLAAGAPPAAKTSACSSNVPFRAILEV